MQLIIDERDHDRLRVRTAADAATSVASAPQRPAPASTGVGPAT